PLRARGEGRPHWGCGLGVARAVGPQVALTALETVLAAAPEGSRVVHCCAPDAPIVLLRRTGADLAVDTSLLGSRGWEGIAVGVEDGMTLYAGCVPTSGAAPRPQTVVDRLAEPWHDLGVPVSRPGGNGVDRRRRLARS